MESETILEKISQETGWDVWSRLSLALEYINNQQDNPAWEDFLRQKQQEELDSEGGE